MSLKSISIFLGGLVLGIIITLSAMTHLGIGINTRSPVGSAEQTSHHHTVNTNYYSTIPVAIKSTPDGIPVPHIEAQTQSSLGTSNSRNEEKPSTTVSAVKLALSSSSTSSTWVPDLEDISYTSDERSGKRIRRKRKDKFKGGEDTLNEISPDAASPLKTNINVSPTSLVLHNSIAPLTLAPDRSIAAALVADASVSSFLQLLGVPLSSGPPKMAEAEKAVSIASVSSSSGGGAENSAKVSVAPSSASSSLFVGNRTDEELAALGPGVVRRPTEAPDFSKQRGVFEKDTPKLHLCNGVFEAYSAAWLTSKAHILEVKSEGYNLTWVNCEMASFIHMRESNNFYKNPDGKGMIIQSLDVLDYSVIHLSAFERSSRKYVHNLWHNKKDRQTQWSRIDAVKNAAQALEKMNNPAVSGREHNWLPEAKRTVVLMPFLGGAMGAGHSELGNRFEYLKACFWSMYEFFPHIVIGVSRKEDVTWGKNHSGLPFYDVILLENLPKGAGLPVGTTQQLKLRLLSGEWDFDYVFYSESDQLILMRILPLLYEQLKKYPSRMLLPHRLMPYSDRVIKEVHKKRVAEQPQDWERTLSCCLERQNCNNRKSWVKINHDKVNVINFLGLYIPLGNVNFLDEQYRSCVLSEKVDFCP